MKTKDGLELFAGILMWFVLGIGFPAMLLYGVGAAQDNTNLIKFFFYAVLPMPVLSWKLFDVYLQNRGFYERYPELRGFGFITLHSPEKSPLRDAPEWMTDAKVLAAVSFAFAMFLGALVSVSGTFATGTPDLVTGSVSPGASLGLAVEPAVFAETMFFNVGLFFLTVGSVYFFLYRRGLSAEWCYRISHVVAFPVTGVGFLYYHNFRYGAVEAAQANILMQGMIYSGATAATHSIIPAYLIHASGNFFSKASSAGIFTSDTSILIAVVGAVLSMLLGAYFVFKEIGGGS